MLMSKKTTGLVSDLSWPAMQLFEVKDILKLVEGGVFDVIFYIKLLN